MLCERLTFINIQHMVTDNFINKKTRGQNYIIMTPCFFYYFTESFNAFPARKAGTFDALR